MTNLDALVPPHEPAEDTLAFAGKAALSMVPVLGPLAAETLAHALESRQAQRQHEFNVAIARALTSAIEQLDETTTIEDIVGSDDFIAAVTRAQRAAAETASQQKRQRLAAAVANGGSWAPFAATEREQFTRLVDEFDALHIWLLHYFTDPAGWLQARDLYQQHANIMMGGIDGPLGSAFNVPQKVWDGPVKQAAADLDRNGLASIPLTTTMSAQGIFAPRTLNKGQRFLAFINETESIAADPPAQL
ncbi:hypothetical protein Bequi_09680 [Brachybacterium sp. JHP9]|uniref:Uncharacterized protein n=1 Tax=Brachybacterium equifaecis TaxID=2910770 RepID=A0ABT0R157_9MICO|nr:hypothetical protein [Brachybacterium equifaecis]MCL6423652.1 hypothetical protein [Brachybacterium equifaecis]